MLPMVIPLHQLALGKPAVNRFLICLLTGLTVVSCSGGEQTGNGPTQVDVLDVAIVKKIGTMSPVGGEGNKFVIVSVNVENNESQPIPSTIAQFWLITDAGTSTTGSAFSALVDGYCDSAMMLEPGASISCPIAFEIPMTSMPIGIRFVLPSTEQVVADIDCPDCSWCGDVCIDLASGSERCGDCSVYLVEGQTCVDGKIVCDDVNLVGCPGGCYDLNTDSDNCGKCGYKIPDGATCVKGVLVCEDNLILCDGECLEECSCIPDCTDRVCGPDPVCEKSCGVCDDGYDCQDGDCVESVCVFDADDYPENGRVGGDPCTADAQCVTGLCATTALLGAMWAGATAVDGMCTMIGCSTAADCGEGAICLDPTILDPTVPFLCGAPCQEDIDCRCGVDYVCLDSQKTDDGGQPIRACLPRTLKNLLECGAAACE